MPGKMTVLDRLIGEGRVKKSPFGVKKTSAELRDPLNYPLDMRKDFDKMKNAANTQWVKMTPEREVYQKGIEARMQPKYMKADEDVLDAVNEMDVYKGEWKEAVEEAKSDMADDWTSALDNQYFEDVDPYYMKVDAPQLDLREYWPSDARTPEEIYEDYNALQDRYYEARDVQHGLRRPEAWMQEQTMTPRYRNYQRAMQQRAANMAMGRDLSRRYAIAYNNLLRRGLTPAEARMYMREYFGGR